MVMIWTWQPMKKIIIINVIRSIQHRRNLHPNSIHRGKIHRINQMFVFHSFWSIIFIFHLSFELKCLSLNSIDSTSKTSSKDLKKDFDDQSSFSSRQDFDDEHISLPIVDEHRPTTSTIDHSTRSFSFLFFRSFVRSIEEILCRND